MGVKLRSRKTSPKKKTLYLDIHDGGRRWLEYLKLYLVGDREKDKETVRLAKAISAKRGLEIANQEHGLNIPSKRKGNFIEYCRKLAQGKRAPNTRVVWNNAILQLTRFAGNPVQFSQVNSYFLQSFKDYLLKNLAPNSAVVYLARIKTACHQAVRDGSFPRIPPWTFPLRRRKRGASTSPLRSWRNWPRHLAVMKRLSRLSYFRPLPVSGIAM